MNNFKFLLFFLFSAFAVNAQTYSPFEKIKNYEDSLFAFYDTVKFSNEQPLKLVSVAEDYRKLDSLDIAKLFLYFYKSTVDTNYFIRIERFGILNKLYAVANYKYLSGKILEAILSPQYFEYLNTGLLIYTDELTPICKQQIADFLNEKMGDSIAQEITYQKIKYDNQSTIEILKKFYPNKYKKTVNELLDSIANIDIKEKTLEYKKSIFNRTSSINFVSKIIGDNFWKDLAPLLEKKYLNYIAMNKDYNTFVEILKVLSRLNYKNYKEEYYTKTKEFVKGIKLNDRMPLCFDGKFILSSIVDVYPECYDCLNLIVEKIYQDSAKKYRCPDLGYYVQGQKQDIMNLANDYITTFDEVFHISNSSNWSAFSVENNSIFNKAGADVIKKWLSKYNQATFPFNKYGGYYKFPKSRDE